MSLNRPWSVEKVEDDWAFNGAFPWLVLDRWGVVIGRFDREDQAWEAIMTTSSFDPKKGGKFEPEKHEPFPGQPDSPHAGHGHKGKTEDGRLKRLRDKLRRKRQG